MFHRAPIRPEAQPGQTSSAAAQSAAPSVNTDQSRVAATPVSSPKPAEESTTMNETATSPTNATSAAASDEYTSPRALDSSASPYQRPGQAPAAAAMRSSAYPSAPSYPTSASTAASAPVVARAAGISTNAAGERRLTIGRGITISGEIEACDHIVVEGTVEAALKGASVLEIAEGGVYYGAVEIEQATIAGRFEGDITVNGRLTIRASGVIIGSMSYKELEVETGAIVEGKIAPIGASLEGRKPAANKNAARKPSRENEDGLFAAKNAAE